MLGEMMRRPTTRQARPDAEIETRQSHNWCQGSKGVKEGGNEGGNEGGKEGGREGWMEM
jgi:hypothetical protein